LAEQPGSKPVPCFGLLSEVHIRVYEHYTARNMRTPDGSPMNIDNPDEFAAAMARVREKLTDNSD
jgi:hypothetical protein